MNARRRTALVRVFRRRIVELRNQQVVEVRAAIGGLTRLQLLLLLAGSGTIGCGGVQMLQLLLDRTAPVLGVGAWWLGGPLIVDLLVVPIVVIAGVAIARLVPLDGPGQRLRRLVHRVHGPR